MSLHSPSLSVIGKNIIDKSMLFYLHTLPGMNCPFKAIANKLSLDPAIELDEENKMSAIRRMIPSFSPFLSLNPLARNMERPCVFTYTPTILILRIVPSNINFSQIKITLSVKGNSCIMPIHEQDGENKSEEKTNNVLTLTYKVDEVSANKNKEQVKEYDPKTITLSKHGLYIPFRFQASRVPNEDISISCDFHNSFKRDDIHYDSSISFMTVSPLLVKSRTYKVHSSGVLSEITLTNQTPFAMKGLSIEVKEKESYIVDKNEYEFEKDIQPNEVVSCIFAFELKSMDVEPIDAEICALNIKYRQKEKDILFSSQISTRMETNKLVTLSLIGVPENIKVLEQFAVKVDVHNSSKNKMKFLIRLNLENSAIVPVGMSSFETDFLPSHSSQIIEITFSAIRQGLHTFPPFHVTAIQENSDSANQEMDITMENGILVTD